MDANLMPTFSPGLEGVVAAQTRLSSVDGQAGELIIAGYPLEEIASRATFEEMVYLLWNDALPNSRELNAFEQALKRSRSLPAHLLDLLAAAAAQGVAPMDALRMGVSVMSLGETGETESAPHDAHNLIASLPVIAAAYWRLLHHQAVIEPHPELGQAANYLYMLTGEPPSPQRTRALETYLNTVIDHGLNASTFTARVIISTGSDLVSAVAGAVGALKGPLHGGAPGPALDMVFEIGSAENAEAVLRAKLERKELLMGFGHRVYKVRDPRADVLAAAAEKLFEHGDRALYDLAKHVEHTALQLLEEYKPGRKLQTNVEFYTALLLHGLGFETELFTPTFAISRAAGWIAHCFEQQEANRIIRPQSIYNGSRERRWISIDQR